MTIGKLEDLKDGSDYCWLLGSFLLSTNNSYKDIYVTYDLTL